MGGLSGDLGVLSVSTMPGKRVFLPRTSAAGAVRNIFRPVQEGGGQAAIGATVEVDHVIDFLPGLRCTKSRER